MVTQERSDLEFIGLIPSGVQEDFKVPGIGLEYGCGTWPVATSELKNRGYPMHIFDPSFKHHPEALQEFFDFIRCCGGDGTFSPTR